MSIHILMLLKIYKRGHIIYNVIYSDSIFMTFLFTFKQIIKKWFKKHNQTNRQHDVDNINKKNYSVVPTTYLCISLFSITSFNFHEHSE